LKRGIAAEKAFKQQQELKSKMKGKKAAQQPKNNKTSQQNSNITNERLSSKL